VHRLLHEVDDQTTINLERLVTELANQMIQDMALIDVKLEIETQLAQRSIPGELAVPIALFAVEALANAFRHAFPSRSDTAKVQVCLRSMPDSTIRLTIKDNGVGFETEQARSSIGLRLLQTFAQQLDGAATVVSQSGQGTTVTLIITDPASPASHAA
jgi:two-component sensor histidine kinase